MISAVITMEDGTVLVHSSKTQHVDIKFKPDFYETHHDNQGKRHINIKKVDEIHEPFVTKQNLTTLDTINSFFKEGMLEQVNQLGFTHKLGVLLYGKQGTGKTSLINHIVDYMVKNKNAIVFFCNNGNKLAAAIGLAKEVREIQDSPIIFVADEFERYCENFESELKNLLDGNDSINNSLFLGATNYIEKVPKTLKERPSRFRVVLEITGVDDKILITQMIKTISNKIKPSLFTPNEIKKIVADIKTITLDEVKHLCLNKVTDLMLPSNLKSSIGFAAKSTKEMDDEHDSHSAMLEELMDIACDSQVPLADLISDLRKKLADDDKMNYGELKLRESEEEMDDYSPWKEIKPMTIKDVISLRDNIKRARNGSK